MFLSPKNNLEVLQCTKLKLLNLKLISNSCQFKCYVYYLYEWYYVKPDYILVLKQVRLFGYLIEYPS